MCIAKFSLKCYTINEVNAMKKRIIITIAILLVFIFGVASYFFVCGGNPQIENFDAVSGDYKIIANAAMKYYNALSYKAERRTLILYDGHMEVSNSINPLVDRAVINLNEEEKSAIKTVNEEFSYGYLWVTDDYVIFWEDETKYYGLIYSENPLSTIWDIKSDWYEGMEYHRINSNWYEIGAFGR